MVSSSLRSSGGGVCELTRGHEPQTRQGVFVGSVFQASERGTGRSQYVTTLWCGRYERSRVSMEHGDSPPTRPGSRRNSDRARAADAASYEHRPPPAQRRCLECRVRISITPYVRGSNGILHRRVGENGRRPRESPRQGWGQRQRVSAPRAEAVASPVVAAKVAGGHRVGVGHVQVHVTSAQPTPPHRRGAHRSTPPTPACAQSLPRRALSGSVQHGHAVFERPTGARVYCCLPRSFAHNHAALVKP